MGFYDIAAAGKRKNSGGGEIPTDSLIWHYAFDNNGNDSSGNSNTLSSDGGITYANNRHDVANKCAYFDGDARFYRLDGINGTFTKQATYCFWIKSTDSADYAFILNGYQASNYTQIFWENGLFKVYDAATSNNGLNIPNPTIDMLDGNWHFVEIKINRESDTFANCFEIKFDNTIQTTTAAGTYIKLDTNFSSYTYIVGAYLNYSYLTGYLDDFRFYSRILTSNEDTALYNEDTAVVVDTDATTYLNAVGIANDSTLYTVGTGSQIMGSTIYTLFSECFAGLKTDGVYDLHNIMYFPIWGTADKNKWNAVNPLDTNAAYRLTYNGTILHSNTGMKSSNVNINTHSCETYFNANQLPQFSNHATVFQRENVLEVLGDRYQIIANGFIFVDVYSPTDLYCGNKGVYPSATMPNAKGMLTTSRTSNNLAKSYRNGVAIGSSTTTVTAVNPNSTFRLVAKSSGINNFNYTEEISFASAGLGMTDEQVLARDTRITTLLTALNIPIL